MTGMQAKTRRKVAEIERLTNLGWTQGQIGDHLGMKQSSVWELFDRYVRKSDRYRPTMPSPCSDEDLLDRWLNDHDIRAMGERAVEETG